MGDLVDVTLRHVDQVINQDVEMQASLIVLKTVMLVNEWRDCSTPQ